MTDTELREQTRRSIALLVAQRRGADEWGVEDYWAAGNILMVCDKLIKARDAAKELEGARTAERIIRSSPDPKIDFQKYIKSLEVSNG